MAELELEGPPSISDVVMKMVDTDGGKHPARAAIKNVLERPELVAGLARLVHLAVVAWERLLFELRGAGATRDDIDALKRAVKAAPEPTLKRPSTRTRVNSVLCIVPESLSDELAAPAGYRLSQRGVHRVRVDGFSGEERLVAVAPTPVLITARYVGIDSPSEQVQLRWLRDGRWQSVTVDRAVVASREIVKLASAGLPVTSETAHEMIDYLAAFETENIGEIPRHRCVHHLGYVGADGELGFLAGRTLIAPDGGEPVHQVSFQGADVGDNQIAGGVSTCGDYDVWLHLVQSLVAYPRVLVALLAALAAPLLRILRAACFVVDISGETSRGKTTAVRLATSAFGNPDERAPDSYMHTWDTTRVALERVPAVLHDLPFVVDETRRAKKREQVEQIVYDVTSGRGRGRGSRDGLAVTGSWSTIMIATGEEPITAFGEAGGTRARVLSLHGMPFGAADASTAALVARVNEVVLESFGHAGPAFVRYLLANRASWPSWRADYAAHCARYAALAAGNPVGHRLAGHLAVLALAEQLVAPILGIPVGSVDAVAPAALVVGVEDADRPKAALEHVMSWATGRQDAFDHASNAMPCSLRLGRWEPDYLAILPNHLRDTLSDRGFSFEEIVGAWHERKWLKTAPGRRDYQCRIGQKRPWTIAIDLLSPDVTAILDGVVTDPPSLNPPNNDEKQDQAESLSPASPPSPAPPLPEDDEPPRYEDGAWCGPPPSSDNAVTAVTDGVTASNDDVNPVTAATESGGDGHQ